MTALKEYQRLESPGLWRPSPEDQRREVIVSIGDATLIISDMAERPLTHWSLAAVERENPDATPAVYSPGSDAGDTLEIEDDLMIEAIERVRRAVSRRRPRPGRLRAVLLSAGLAIILALTVFWLPEALVRNAVAVVPDAKRSEIGERLLSDISRVAGMPCSTPLGNRALDRLHDRLRGEDAQGRFVVVRSGVRDTVELPGGIVVLNRALVEDYEDPAVVAGFILAEGLRSRVEDPVARFLHDRGPIAAFRLLTTGEVTDAALAAHAENLLADPAPPVPSQALLARFREADVPSSPYAFARDISGETTLDLIEADPVDPEEARPLLSDGDWISLQGICTT